MSAIFSDCGLHRLRLDRTVAEAGLVFAFFGVNPSKAGEKDDDVAAGVLVEDQTTLKWRGFTVRNGGMRYIAANPFTLVATDPRELALADEPIHAMNQIHLGEVIAEADILVPCWGNSAKVPRHMRHHLSSLKDRIFDSGKPVKIFGLTKSGDPMHPLMLGYNTPLVEWART